MSFSSNERKKKMEDASEENCEEKVHETVSYRGPDQHQELVESPTSPYNNLQTNIRLQPMDVLLAQAAAHYGGLLSPEFFLNKSESPASTGDGQSPSEIDQSPYSPLNSHPPSVSTNQKMEKLFIFPKVTTACEKGNESLKTIDDIQMKMERVEILADDSEEYEEKEWIEWPEKYIERKGFRLGILPGDFYKNQLRPCYYVKLPHRSNYKILVTNNNQAACDLDLYVNGQLTNCLRLPAETSRFVDGPAYSEYAFKLFRSFDVPSGINVTEGAKQNGIVKAVFTPQKIENSRRLRAVSEPLQIKNPVDDFLEDFFGSNDIKKQRSFTNEQIYDETLRSFDMSQIAEGVTLLHGKKKKKKYLIAPEMEVDMSKRVILYLRLIASLTEELDATEEEEVYNLEPPPLPSKSDM